ncbi:MAG: SpoIIE family protein phosphatase, partial [Oscillospiraceae bacterium]|nr:SpoIIE family protein phosphatase [Oscillospiraceae bacterium]
MGQFLLSGGVGQNLTEVIAMPAIILSGTFLRKFFGGEKNLPPAFSGIHAAAAYIICGVIAAVAYKFTGGLFLAIIFRGVLCGGAAFFAANFFSASEKGFTMTDEVKISAAVVYALSICMLCGVKFGTFNAGRMVGAFFAAAAAYRFGSGAGGMLAAVSSLAAGVASPSLLTSSPILICSAIGSGLFRKKCRLAVSAAFIGMGLGGALILGMPKDGIRLLGDMITAAAAFCFLPDNVYRRSLPKTPISASEAVRCSGRRMKFASAAVSEVRESFDKAAKVLDRSERENDISSEVCGKICSQCRSGAFCGENPQHRAETYFRPAEDFLEKKGYITEKELHKGLECCPHKNLLAEAFTDIYRKKQIEKRLTEAALSMREITSEQLLGTEKMLDFLSRAPEIYPSCDEELSCRIREFLAEAGAEKPAVSVFFDSGGRIFAECFYEGLLNIGMEELAEKISDAADRDIDVPEAVTMGEVTRLCFHEPTTFEAEIGQARVNGREDASGDFGTVFRDGFGSVSVLISDGMGSGARAAVESCMTVSLMTKIMRAGLGSEYAVRLINLLLLTKSSDECFSTIDLLTVNLFTGKSEIVKLGAAQTFLKTNGTVKNVEGWSTPVGIVGSVEISR